MKHKTIELPNFVQPQPWHTEATTEAIEKYNATRAKLAESSCAAGCSTPAASARRSLLAVSRGAALVRVRAGAR